MIHCDFYIANNGFYLRRKKKERPRGSIKNALDIFMEFEKNALLKKVWEFRFFGIFKNRERVKKYMKWAMTPKYELAVCKWGVYTPLIRIESKMLFYEKDEVKVRGMSDLYKIDDSTQESLNENMNFIVNQLMQHQQMKQEAKKRKKKRASETNQDASNDDNDDEKQKQSDEEMGDDERDSDQRDEIINIMSDADDHKESDVEINNMCDGQTIINDANDVNINKRKHTKKRRFRQINHDENELNDNCHPKRKKQRKGRNIRRKQINSNHNHYSECDTSSPLQESSSCSTTSIAIPTNVTQPTTSSHQAYTQNTNVTDYMTPSKPPPPKSLRKRKCVNTNKMKNITKIIRRSSYNPDPNCTLPTLELTDNGETYVC